MVPYQIKRNFAIIFKPMTMFTVNILTPNIIVVEKVYPNLTFIQVHLTTNEVS